MKIALTGSSGLLGKFISLEAESYGHQVIPVQFKNGINGEFIESIQSSLKIIKDCDFIINCSASKNPKSSFDFFLNTDVPKLIEHHIAAHRLDCHFIHISSINIVFDQLKDNYTKSKRKGESLLDPKVTTIIRPGLIWSPANDRSIKKIELYMRNRFLPHIMVKPGNLYNPIDPKSLAKFLINNLTYLKIDPKIINILGNKKISLWALMEKVANSHAVKLYPVRVSWFKFIPIRTFIKFSIAGELLNQFLHIDRTILPPNCTGSVIHLPHPDL